MTASQALFHTLLAATVAGPAIDDAVLTAARLAHLHEARLYIVPWGAGYDGRSAPSRTPSRPIAANGSGAAAQRIYAHYATRFPFLKPEDVRIVLGVAWEALFRSAVELDCDLIVMGPHSRPPDSVMAPQTKRFLGSTADGVISRSRCPVLIANGAFGAGELDFKHIVVGVDFSSSCTAAVGMAALFARRCDAFITAFHMLPIAPYPKYSPETLQADHERQQKRMHELCRRLLKGTGYQSVLKTGVRPHTEILRFIEHVGADLIIMGSHTKDRTGKWYAGSVVQRITCHARCPVIVVNGPEALTPWGFDPNVA